MSLINYLFSSSVTFRRDNLIQFNRIAILALQYSITLHIISLLMCSGDISKGKFINRACSLIFNKFFSFYFFLLAFFFIISMFSPVKVLISNSYFYKFIIYNLSKIYINCDDREIYFLFGIFVSCFIILGFMSFYGKEKLILIFGWIVAVLWSSLFFYIIGASDIGLKLFIIKRLLFALCGYIKNIGFIFLAFSHLNTLEACIKFKKFLKFPNNSPFYSSFASNHHVSAMKKEKNFRTGWRLYFCIPRGRFKKPTNNKKNKNNLLIFFFIFPG